MALTDLSEMPLAGRSSEMQQIAKLSFITIPADSCYGGDFCSFLCRWGSFSAVGSYPSCEVANMAEPAARVE